MVPVLVAVRESVAPTQMGVLLLATGAAGVDLTVTEVVPAVLVHPKEVAVTEYVPP